MIQVRQQDCPVALACGMVGDHKHDRCGECGAVDFSGACQTCRTMRPTRARQIAESWRADAR